MRLAKTNEAEIKTLIDFLKELEWLREELNNNDFEDARIDKEDFPLLSTFDKQSIQNFLFDICNHAKSLFWERILWNCQTLLDSCADPNLTYIDFKPEMKKLFEPKGFKDKNGKQFGEDDVLQFTHHSGYLLETGKMLVCWDEENGCYGYKYEHSMFKDIIYPFSQHDELKKDVLNHCEIIGDIEKNPELLSVFQ